MNVYNGTAMYTRGCTLDEILPLTSWRTSTLVNPRHVSPHPESRLDAANNLLVPWRPKRSMHWTGVVWRQKPLQSQGSGIDDDDSLSNQLSQPPTLTSYYTAPDQTPQGSQPTTPVDGPATPRIRVTRTTLSISTDNLKDTVPLQPLSDETVSPTSCLHSIFRESSRAS
ncbi:hypothetical protein BDN67DRAFT_692255 [Paxillus ammoniavirescens]|nr:hypothetical protein BDN67DRAFT_692255 [Paxillus ammoniavirescens]